MLMRYMPAYHEAAAIETNIQAWVYRMINTPRQLQEKMALFWHMIFCAGHSKIDSGQEMGRMIQMFRDHGMGNFRHLLWLLSTSPAMVYYLDNSESHKENLNENYGRELLELFSLGGWQGRGVQLLRGRRKGLRPRLHRLEHRSLLPALPLWSQPVGVPL